MSYDIAVWVGDQPRDDEAAKSTFDALVDDRDRLPARPPDTRILDYIVALTERFPDLTALPDDAVDDSPWADGPLRDNVEGTFFYFALTHSGVDEALPFIAHTARRHGLVCFDPQQGRIVEPGQERRHEPLREIASRVTRETAESLGFKWSRGIGRMAVAPEIEGVFGVMNASGTRAPLALRARVGVVLRRYEAELRDLLERRNSGYEYTVITDLGSLVPPEGAHWYEDVSDEQSVRELLARFRSDVEQVGIPWMRGFSDLLTIVARLREEDSYHALCIALLVYRDLGQPEAALALLDEPESQPWGQEFMTRDWSMLDRKLRPALLEQARMVR